MSRDLQKHVPEYPDVTGVSQYKAVEISRAKPMILDDECTVLARHIIGRSPSNYVLAKYRAAHEFKADSSLAPVDSFDAFLLTLARRHFMAARIVDSYTAIFKKNSVFRRKAVLVLAILESCPPFYRSFDVPDASHGLTVTLTLLLQGIRFALILGVAALFLIPISLCFGLSGLLIGKDRQT